MNNTTLEFPRGSIASGKSPVYQPKTNPSGFIAKQVVHPPDSYSRRELNARTLWPDTRMMVSSTKLIVHFAKAEPSSLSASPSHLKTEKSENNSRLCGKFWPKSSKFSSLKEMTQVHSLSLHSTYDHKFLRNGVENECSNLLHLETDSCVISLILICVFLVFLMMYYNRSSLKSAIWLRIARPMCDGRLGEGGPFLYLLPFSTFSEILFYMFTFFYIFPFFLLFFYLFLSSTFFQTFCFLKLFFLKKSFLPPFL